MLDISRHVINGDMQTMKGIVRTIKNGHFFAELEWLYRNVYDDYGVLMIVCRPIEWIRIKSVLPRLRKEGRVYGA